MQAKNDVLLIIAGYGARGNYGSDTRLEDIICLDSNNFIPIVKWNQSISDTRGTVSIFISSAHKRRSSPFNNHKKDDPDEKARY
jgi:hypothetical protein